MEANLIPQEAIRRGLPLPSDCDIFLSVFWTRMGTPVSIDGKYFLSGTHYEFCDAMRGNRQNGRPRVLVYKRDDVPALKLDDPDLDEKRSQFERLREFFREFKDPETGELTGGYKIFTKPDDYRVMLESNLRFIIKQLLQEDEQNDKSEQVFENCTSLKSKFAKEYSVTATASEEWTGSPFPGLRAFGIKDVPIFFGRGRETDLLVARVRENDFTAVVGASGSGKSSLVAAGLIPRLLSTSKIGGILTVTTSPDLLGAGNPFAALAAALLKDVPKFTRRNLARDLEKSPETLTNIFRELQDSESTVSLILLFIDQFEEVFSTIRQAYRVPFIKMLADVSQVEVARVVVTLRGDFYGECLHIPEMSQLLERGTFPVTVPRIVDLHDMLARPARRAGLSFEEGLIQRILDDTGSEPGSLALMAYTLDELFHACQGNIVLSHGKYEELGGVQGAIGKRSETIFGELDEEAQSALPIVFRELVEVDDRGTATRRREPALRAESTDAARRFIERMTEARLLVRSRGDEDAAYIEVAHEALFRSWTRLQIWIEDTKDELRLLRQVRLAAQEWERNGRAAAYLWPHERLVPVYRMRGHLKIQLDEITTDFVEPELERLSQEMSESSIKRHRKLAIVERMVQIGGKEAIDSLIKTLDPANPDNFRIHAVRALSNLGATKAFEEIVSILQRSSSVKHKSSIISSLGILGDNRAIPIIADALKWRGLRRGYLHRYYSEDLQRAAAVALGRIGNTEALPYLFQVIAREPSPKIVSAAERAIQRIEKLNSK